MPIPSRPSYFSSVLVLLSGQAATADDGPRSYGDVLGTSFVGSVLSFEDEPGLKRQLRLDGVQPAENGGLIYSLSIIESDHVKPLCDGPNLAIPLAGSWDKRGDWQAEGSTFACHDGVLAKCVRWGYVPWEQDLRSYHQTCMRMARADYCGDGRGHTEDGTPINVWDDLPILTRAFVPGMTFEAGWTSDGAIGIERTRFPEAMDYVRQHCPERLAKNQPVSCDGKSDDGAVLCNESYPRNTLFKTTKR